MIDDELKSGDYTRLVVKGHTEEGEPAQRVPWRRVYMTGDSAQAAGFASFLKLLREPLERAALDKVIHQRFPGLSLIREETGNEITPADDLPEDLPLGEDVDDEEDNVQLLQRAVLQRLDEWREARTRSGNEIASNIPTYIGIGLKGDAGLIAAGIGGTLVAGIIGWRGAQQKNKLVETLKIWVAYQNDVQAGRAQALALQMFRGNAVGNEAQAGRAQALANLNIRMNESGLLFSGIEEQDLSRFKPGELDRLCGGLAEKYGIWYDKTTLGERVKKLRWPDQDKRLETASWLHHHSLADMFRAAAASAKVIGHYGWGQVRDIWRNPRSPETWKRIGTGLVDTPLLTYDIARHFVDNARRLRAEARHIDRQNGNPTTDCPQTLQQIRIEEVGSIHGKVDGHLIAELQTTLDDLNRERRGGLWMTGAMAGETLFYAGHAWNAANAAAGLVQPSPATAAETAAQTWMDHDGMALGLSLFSMALASGAWAHIGREISLIKDEVASRRARAFDELYPQIANQYSERANGADADAPGGEPS